MRKKDDEKEKSIKEAVIKLILQEGFHGTSISKIAKLAGVSPATVYIYFENKEIMLQDIYSEYSEEIFDYLLNRVNRGMEGQQLIEILVRSYYNYIRENKEIFSFVEQFSNCPSLSGSCSEIKGICNINNLIAEMKNSRIIKDYNNDNLLAIIFYPVKAIAVDNRKSETERADLLREMIKIIQDALLI
ncbi:TetR/AcrR family transcriptional regulator [Sinanaerobacter chloroacetimidivorans]|uniref:TetR/AcrR family transcriptional regulator n=1 Tax=Sinanaerobacter chloroacetimidivorans TaxID=2818044 RepID=A0A8J8AZM0_9FIRM|nr:TetR/AcrR family transcriptional regulator [Sinanaerobacter chloroacetimidivorans]MBR0596678.1 TetR/AcrR family transcriptional regulator [Sinanaerobacter chloroacetimidivorans]